MAGLDYYLYLSLAYDNSGSDVINQDTFDDCIAPAYEYIDGVQSLTSFPFLEERWYEGGWNTSFADLQILHKWVGPELPNGFTALQDMFEAAADAIVWTDSDGLRPTAIGNLDFVGATPLGGGAFYNAAYFFEPAETGLGGRIFDFRQYGASGHNMHMSVLNLDIYGAIPGSVTEQESLEQWEVDSLQMYHVFSRRVLIRDLA